MGTITEDIKKLGFGLMRLPKNGDVIDIEQTKVMVDKFMEAGFNYFDTAWAYAGSEEAIKKALVERYPRESYYLATKNAPWISAKTREEAIGQLETSLERSGAGYFDFYLLHNLGAQRTAVFDQFDMWTWANELKASGKIKHLGFSFHDTADKLIPILDAHPEVEFVQLQINYADWESDSIQSRKCYEICEERNIPVIVMEPVKGGMLASPHPSVEKIFKTANPDASCSSWAVKFAANLPGVLTVLSGMSSIEQMEDNLSYMKDFTGLTSEESAVIEEARKTLETIPVIPCTSCDYCAKVCPMDVGVSGTFFGMNLLTLYGNKDIALREMAFKVEKPGHKTAVDCIKCGACEEACPQHIAIRDRLEEAAKALY